MHRERVYEFTHNGMPCVLKDKDIAECFPSIASKGRYTFILTDGTLLQGEDVKEVKRRISSTLLSNYHGAN